MLLPEGFALPPLPYLAVLAAALAGVAYGLSQRSLEVTSRHVLALAPWMTVGSSLYVLYSVGALPAPVSPLAGTPSVYLTVAAVVGAIWIGADSSPTTRERVPTVLAASGVVAFTPVFLAALWWGAQEGSLTPFWPGVAVVISVPSALAAWSVLKRLVPRIVITGHAGLLAVFAHTLDGISTAVGVDVLGFGEQTPLSAAIMHFAGTLPTAELLGVGWLFVLVKLAIAGLVVTLFADYVEEDPTEGYLFLALIAAVGLGPGVHNLLLFTVAG
ncbi:MAG: DUF63 family protein [Halopenitus sp.]